MIYAVVLSQTRWYDLIMKLNNVQCCCAIPV